MSCMVGQGGEHARKSSLNSACTAAAMSCGNGLPVHAYTAASLTSSADIAVACLGTPHEPPSSIGHPPLERLSTPLPRFPCHDVSGHP